MWFAKLFGGRYDELEDEQPTATVAPEVRAAAALRSVARPPSRPSSAASASGRPAAPKPKGFDPYNSGAFDRNNAWERVIRR